MPERWKNDEELFALVRAELFSAVVGDTMDKMGLTHQFLPPEIRPLAPDMFLAGRAMPVLVADVFEEVTGAGGANPVMAKPFGLLLEAIDDLKPHEVFACTGGSRGYALWGELVSTRAAKLGAAGAILNGYSRDTGGILALGFPTFSRGSYAQDISVRGKVVDFRIPVEIGAARIEPGDILIGDVDGVCVVPRKAEEEVFHRALEKARGEKKVKQAIEAGMSARAAFDEFGIM